MVTPNRIILLVIVLVVLILGPDNSCLRARGVDFSFVDELTILKVHVMPTKVKAISRKKAAREGHRTTVKRIAYAVSEQLDASHSDVNLDENKQALALLVSKLHQQRQSLHIKLETLKVVDEEILSIVEKEEIEDEIREADLVNELIQLTIARIYNFLETFKSPAKTLDAPKDETPVSPSKVVTIDFLSSKDSVESPVNLPVSAGNVEPSNNLVESSNPTPSLSLPTQETIPRVKLPKLDLRKFDGEVSTWPTFWDAFESSIHKNPTLAPIDKFNYLNSLLMKPALDAISGLSLSASNYEEAIAILKRDLETSNKLSIATWIFFLMLAL